MLQLARAALTPSQTFAFLSDLYRTARETTSRPERDDSGIRWRLRRDAKACARAFAHGLADALVEKSAPRYAVRLRHPTREGYRPRILHLIPNVFVGGSTQLVVDIHDHLGHAFEMHVITAALAPGGPHTGMRITRLPLGARKPDFDEAIRAIEPDLVHVHYWGSTDDVWYEPAYRSVLEAGFPVLQNVNTPVAPYRDPRVRTVFVSAFVRDVYAREMTDAPIVHPGIDLAHWQPSGRAHADAADTVLMVYRLDRDKLDLESIDPVIEAIRLRPQTRVIVVGTGPLLGPFAARLEAAGCRANVDFRGYVPYGALPALYAQASVFLAPVLRESFGQVVPFAMAMGLAVVGNRVGALPEILGGSDTLGRDSGETGAILARLLDDPVRRAALGEANRRRAVDFGIESMIAAYEAQYRAMCRLGRRVS